MGGDGSILGVVIAIVGVIGAILVARISNPRDDEREREPADADERRAAELKVSPEIWRRFTVLETKVDHLTEIVEEQRTKVSTLERLLRLAMRIIRRANRRLHAAELPTEEVPAELVPYSIE
ncbi:hypothetical protein ACFXKX_23745 [Streptomyces scopuliridis]|uniref:hypothetical protein n=1 Tax=Streptomyces scopuliridis TaxID=452529 RepID=UPI00369B18CB